MAPGLVMVCVTVTVGTLQALVTAGADHFLLYALLPAITTWKSFLH